MPKKNLVVHLVRVRPRLIAAVAFGVAAALLAPGAGRPITHFLTGWNVGVWSYLAMIAWLMGHASPSKVRAVAEREDATAEAVLLFMTIAAIASLAAIVMELAAIKTLPAADLTLQYALTGSTLLGSWLMVNVMFTLHYAHMYYTAPETRRPIFFPDQDPVQPDYWDFLYFSFTIAVAAQTSDASVMTRDMRKVVVGQSVLSFIFNAAIIGLSINVAAGLIGS
jgi:uncharacterized membrane protein